MTLQEKSLYHQIHPAKLFTDWSTGIVVLHPSWHHELLAVLLIAFVPSIVVSLLIIRHVDLEKYKQSAFGNYISRYMTRPVEIIRLAGYATAVIGAWYHIVWSIPIGFLIILCAWSGGLVIEAHHR